MSRVYNPCVDCRFAKAEYGFVCTHHQVERADPVLGATNPDCRDAREMVGKCGPHGEYFQKLPAKRSLLQKIKEAFKSDGF